MLDQTLGSIESGRAPDMSERARTVNHWAPYIQSATNTQHSSKHQALSSVCSMVVGASDGRVETKVKGPMGM